jgi:hypothetical protein
MSTARSLLLLALLALAAANCGPARSVAAIADAERLRAEVSDSTTQSYAAFEIARGDAFLRHARRAAGHSRHELATTFARNAADSFTQARAVSRENQKLRHFRPYRLDWDSPVEP